MMLSRVVDDRIGHDEFVGDTAIVLVDGVEQQAEDDHRQHADPGALAKLRPADDERDDECGHCARRVDHDALLPARLLEPQPMKDHAAL